MTPERIASTPPTICTPVFNLDKIYDDIDDDYDVADDEEDDGDWHLIGQHWVLLDSLASPSSTNKDLKDLNVKMISILIWFNFKTNRQGTKIIYIY